MPSATTIVAELTKSRSIEAVKVYQSGQGLPTGHINHYITDGEIMLASLVVTTLDIKVRFSVATCEDAAASVSRLNCGTTKSHL